MTASNNKIIRQHQHTSITFGSIGRHPFIYCHRIYLIWVCTLQPISPSMKRLKNAVSVCAFVPLI